MSQWMRDREQGGDSVSMLLAGPPGRVTTWYQVLMADQRFRVSSFANDQEDLQRKLANRPEVVLIDAIIFPGPPPMIDFLTSIPGAAYVLLPGDVPDETVGQIQAVPSVKGVFRGDVNLAELVGRMYDTAMTLRSRAPALEGPWRGDKRPGGIAGLRIVTVWNEAGGVGKTTVASNLAYEASRRGLQTLLVGLGAPDDLPMILGLEPEPNLSGWQANPVPEGLRTLIQKVGDLDVIAGFRNVIDEARAMGSQPEEPGSIPSLAMTAAYNGYAVIVLDAPHSTTAPAAIMSANTLILVSRPTLAGAQRTVEAYRTVVHRLAGEHRIVPANIFVVLNLVGNGDYAVDEWHRMTAIALKKIGLGAPPVAVALPEDPAVKTAQNNGKFAMLVSDGLARGIHTLADALFGSQAEGNRERKSRVLKIGGLRFRIRK
jgi:arsenite-transporting ATPase